MRYRKDLLSKRLTYWGEWVLKTVGGLGYATMTVEGRCQEDGLIAYQNNNIRYRLVECGEEKQKILQAVQLTANGHEKVIRQGRDLHYEKHRTEQAVNQAVLSLPEIVHRTVIYFAYLDCMGERKGAKAMGIPVWKFARIMREARIWVAAKLDINPWR